MDAKLESRMDIKKKIYKWLKMKQAHDFIKSKLYWSVLIRYLNKLTNLANQWNALGGVN